MLEKTVLLRRSFWLRRVTLVCVSVLFSGLFLSFFWASSSSLMSRKHRFSENVVSLITSLGRYSCYYHRSVDNLITGHSACEGSWYTICISNSTNTSWWKRALTFASVATRKQKMSSWNWSSSPGRLREHACLMDLNVSSPEFTRVCSWTFNVVVFHVKFCLGLSLF